MTNTKKYFIISAILFVAFIIMTYLAATYDVQAIGPQGSKVGFAAINGPIAQKLPYNDLAYTLSEVLGYLAISTVCIFGLFGVMQLFIRKGFKKVDKDLYALLGLYVLVLIIYIIFEKLIINYRPVILEEGLEASYPSSHTMLSVAFVSAAFQQFSVRLKKRSTRNTVLVLCAIDGVAMVICRILAGVHWFTDIIAGVLVAAACFMLYLGVFKTIHNGNKKEE
ncbi:MAG: phosphatase PAP2 family protein [Lachnospiraceae bacterium]|nr:phosphatase PAP2 family protein [Lachnospiraceae bacterium]